MEWLGLDITLCSSDCPRSNTCLRWTLMNKRHPKGVYSVADFNGGDKCEYYLEDDRDAFKSDNPYQE